LVLVVQPLDPAEDLAESYPATGHEPQGSAHLTVLAPPALDGTVQVAVVAGKDQFDGLATLRITLSLKLFDRLCHGRRPVAGLPSATPLLEEHRAGQVDRDLGVDRTLCVLNGGMDFSV